MLASRRGGVPILAATALLLTAIQYGTTVRYGFYYDDYHFVHPYTAHEVAAAFRGPWDLSGIETPYYRPLTICLYAARFELLGLNADACHALSLVLFAFAATIFGWFASRITGALRSGLLAIAIFVAHPGMPYSAVAWITNQMHLAQLIVVMGAFTWWFAVRRRTAVWWLPLIPLQIVALLLKEDGVMLLPALVAVHTLRKYLVEPDLPHVPVAFLAPAALMLAAILAVRNSALGAVPAHHAPSLDQAWTNVSRGFSEVFRLVSGRRPRPFQIAAGWFVTAVPLLALLSWRRVSPATRFAMLTGLALGCLFDLPFVFIVKPEQLHLVSAGGALLLTASGMAILEAWGRTRVRSAIVLAALAAGLALLSVVARDLTRDFEPFSRIVLWTDGIVQEWAAVPVELRAYLADKRSAGAEARLSANPAQALTDVAYGLHGIETNPEGVRLQWMAGRRTDIFVRADKRLVTIPLRHEFGAFQEPARVRTVADGRLLEEFTLADGTWHSVTISLRRSDTPRLSGMHRIQIRIDHAWIPAQIIPGSPDTRTLGLQIGRIEIR